MKIVFVSSFISPHIKPLCDELYLKPSVDFIYIQTIQITNERRNMGYENNNVPYVIDYYGDTKKCNELIDMADCVIFNSGSSDIRIVKDRILSNKLTFICNERVFKKGALKYADPRLWKQTQINILARKKKTFLLCLGQYVSKDFEKIGFEKNKSFKFGYFPKINDNSESIYTPVETIRIIWVGRMIQCKHPERMIKIARELLRTGISFEIIMIGDGPRRPRVESLVNKWRLEKYVKI